MASAENNQKAQNVGPRIGSPFNETTNIQLELHRYVCKTEELQNGSKDYVSKL